MFTFSLPIKSWNTPEVLCLAFFVHVCFPVMTLSPCPSSCGLIIQEPVQFVLGRAPLHMPIKPGKLISQDFFCFLKLP